MSAYHYTATDVRVSDKPCKLLSVIVVTDGGGPGKVDIYNGTSADSSYKVVTLRCPANQAQQYRWEGLYLDRGLYVDIVEKADFVTVEWESVGYPDS